MEAKDLLTDTATANELAKKYSNTAKTFNDWAKEMNVAPEKLAEII
jgi:hypothetical protein